MTEANYRPEILRIARLLGVEPDRLDFLLLVSDDDLLAFRDQVTDTLFDAHTGTLRRLGTAAKLLPSAVLAKIAEKVFGPMLCARVAGMVDPVKAAETAKRLSPSFLADVAVELDPRRAHAVISTLPPKLVVPVAVELACRHEWITLGTFVGYLPEEPLAACVNELDEAALLHTASVAESPAAISRVLELIPRKRRSALLRTASEQRIWPALLRLADGLPDQLISELAELLAEQDIAVINELVDAVAEEELWPELLPFARVLPAHVQATVADIARTLNPKVRADIVREAKRVGVLADLGPIADALTTKAA